MFTRVVEITTKPGKANDVANMIHEKVLPILRKQAGFVDEAVLMADKEPNRVLALSFWNTKEDAERYHREEYQKISDMLSPHVENAPTIRRFNVHTSTWHKIAAAA